MASLDVSDLENWVGKAIGGGNLRDPIHVNDIRRWAQAMHNPHPLYFDEEYAQGSRFSQIVAPQSFTVVCSDSHGAAPAVQGRLEGTQMLFGGDEWWFGDGKSSAPRIFPGDSIRQERRFHDYSVKDTKFAGPTVFARGDTTYLNQRGETVAKQRSTAIRYQPEEARKRKNSKADEVEPEWSDAEKAALEEKKLAYYQSFRTLGHGRPKIEKGLKLATRPIGPHSALTFTTEWRAYLMNVWGAFRPDGLPTSLRQAGWLKEMDKNMEAAKVDPAEADGLYKGSSRGHAQPKYAQLIGLGRGYGYGASMGAWILDYVSNWAGESGEIVHAKLSYVAPAFTGDATFVDGEVIETGELVVVKVAMSNQKGAAVASGTAEIRFV